MLTRPTLRYCATAGALGLGWFVVLLIPGMTREWLCASGWLEDGSDPYRLRLTAIRPAAD